MKKQVYSCGIDYLQVMDEDGGIDLQLMPSIPDSKIVEMYKWMLFTRNLDAKTLSLQRQGRAVTYAPLVGEEASQIGVALAMRKDDVLAPSFRQHGIHIARGQPLDDYFIYWKGYEDGSKSARSINALAVCVPVGTQVPHGAGVAFAQRYMGKDAATVAYVGDGGTSEGDFHEALNFAGVYKLPLIVVIENNQWAISVPRKGQTAAETLAQKAVAAGIRGVQVDGNDVLAVYKAAADALASAKDGPTLIECVTYRMGMHTTADDPTKYRAEEEVNAWKARDPLRRVNLYLTSKGLWSSQLEQETTEQHQRQIDEAVERAEQFKPDPRGMFETLYSFMPDALKEEEDNAVSNNFWM